MLISWNGKLDILKKKPNTHYVILSASGLYERAKMCRISSGKDGLEMAIPLYLLHPFWGLDCLYPQKKIVEVSLKTNPDDRVLIKDQNDATEFEILLTSVNLDINYVHLEVSEFE